MKDFSTGKVYLPKATVQEFGPSFARAGHDIRKLHTEAGILNGFLDTLSPEARAKFKAEMDACAEAASKKTTPSR